MFIMQHPEAFCELFSLSCFTGDKESTEGNEWGAVGPVPITSVWLCDFEAKLRNSLANKPFPSYGISD